MKALCLYFHVMPFGTLVEICLWSHLAVKGLKTDEDIPPQRRQILQTFVLRGEQSGPHHTSVFKF